MKPKTPKKHSEPKGRKPAEMIPTVYPSMGSLSGTVPIPIDLLKNAKRSGCPGFEESGRVRLIEVLEWIFARDEDGEVKDWAKHGKKFDALIKEVKHSRLVGSVVSRDNVITGAQEIMGMLFSELDRVFCLEFPPLAKGLDEVSIRHRSEIAIAKLKESLRLRFEKMGKAEE